MVKQHKLQFNICLISEVHAEGGRGMSGNRYRALFKTIPSHEFDDRIKSFFETSELIRLFNQAIIGHDVSSILTLCFLNWLHGHQTGRSDWFHSILPNLLE